MKLMTVVKAFLYLILAGLLVEAAHLGAYLLSQPDDVLVMLGVLMIGLVGAVLVSVAVHLFKRSAWDEDYENFDDFDGAA